MENTFCQTMLGQMYVFKTFSPARQPWEGMPSQNRDGMEKRKNPKTIEFASACKTPETPLKYSVLKVWREFRVQDKERKMRLKAKKINKEIRIWNFLWSRERERKGWMCIITN